MLLDSQKDAHLIYEAGESSGYPPCDDYSFCYQGTSFEPIPMTSACRTWDPVTNLSLGSIHLRWNDPLVITGTVFNAGWYTSTATTIRVTAAISDTIYRCWTHEDVAIPSLNPYEILPVPANLYMPFLPRRVTKG